ncbi:Major facilitator superfamily protein [Rhynchospora pubera]|uniref:Major facilitator superfamily protein n=1 Tax=Rhynchospora pubera TaxID=906938 RepID=A0AAV8FD45_9POAL|nr:Major facilitator superfamily protein [Rhynchospora pubera]
MEKAKESTSETTLRHPLLSSKLKKPPKSKYAFASAMIASMASLLAGYNIGVMSGAQIFIKDDLKISDVQIEILAGSVHIYSLVGSLTAGWTSDCIGRRNTLLLTSIIYLLGPLITCSANNYFWLMVGRFVTGIAIGYMVVVHIYVAEVSPAATRGFLTALPEVAINAGLLFGYVSNFAFAYLPVRLSWRIMFALASVPPILLGFGAFSLPESPRWLVMKGQLGKAREVLTQISGSREEAEAQLIEIKEKAGITREDTEVVSTQNYSQDKNIWTELVVTPTPVVCRIIITVLALQFLEQASGIDAVVLYSPRIFEKAGMTTTKELLGATIIVGLTKTALILVPMFLSDRVGRRPLLLSSTAGMAGSLIMLGLGLQMVGDFVIAPTWIVAVCIMAVLSYVGFFSAGLGPVTMAYSSKTIPLKLRAQGMGLAIAVNRLVCGVVAMTFISIYEEISIPCTFYMYAVIIGFAFVFVYFCLPETRGKSLEEIEVLFGKN